jgi:hypothetical protein
MKLCTASVVVCLVASLSACGPATEQPPPPGPQPDAGMPPISLADEFAGIWNGTANLQIPPPPGRAVDAGLILTVTKAQSEIRAVGLCPMSSAGLVLAGEGRAAASTTPIICPPQPSLFGCADVGLIFYDVRAELSEDGTTLRVTSGGAFHSPPSDRDDPINGVPGGCGAEGELMQSAELSR